MKTKDNIKNRWNKMVCVILGVAMMACCLCGCGARQKRIDYWKELDQHAVTVGTTDYTLGDLVFFVAYEEWLVQQQALLYDAKHTNAYWNLHIDGEFIRLSARREAMNMAIHDLYLYQRALEEEITLNDEEMELAALRAQDFWVDLGEDARVRIEEAGLKECLFNTIHQVAQGQKYQLVQAALDERSMEDYNTDGIVYKAKIEEYGYEINHEIWEGLSFGKITLSH